MQSENTQSESSIWRRLPHYYLRHRYSVLFASLLLTLVISPIISELQQSGSLIEVLLFVSLATASIGAGTPRERTRLLLFVVVTALLRFLGRWLHVNHADTLSTLLWLTLGVAAAVRCLRFALLGRRIDVEHLAAALSAYLLAGHFFGIAYWQVSTLWPASFAASGVATSLDLQSCVYFSFVTLATLGYGDIVPLGPSARGLAVGEAILGQLYLAVLVARLVGAARSSSLSKSQEESLHDPQNRD